MNTSTAPHADVRPDVLPLLSDPRPHGLDAIRLALASEWGITPPEPNAHGDFGLRVKGVALTFMAIEGADAFVVRSLVGSLRRDDANRALRLLADNLRLPNAGSGALSLDERDDVLLTRRFDHAHLRWDDLLQALDAMALRTLACRRHCEPVAA